MDRRVALTAVVVVSALAGAGGWWLATRPRDREVAIDAVLVRGDRLLTVEVVAGAPPCESDLRVSVDESAEQVRLTARVRVATGKTCPAIAIRHGTAVELSAPLADRPVWDGHLDRGIVVSGR